MYYFCAIDPILFFVILRRKGNQKFHSLTLSKNFLAFSMHFRSIAHNAGEAAWRRQGEHYRLLEPQTVKFPTKGY